MQTLALDLAPGEVVYSQTNSMCWMNDAIEMDTHTGGGVLSGLMRSFTGGSFFITDFTSRGDGHIAFAPRFPGTILPERCMTPFISAMVFCCAPTLRPCKFEPWNNARHHCA